MHRNNFFNFSKLHFFFIRGFQEHECPTERCGGGQITSHLFFAGIDFDSGDRAPSSLILSCPQQHRQPSKYYADAPPPKPLNQKLDAQRGTFTRVGHCL